MKNLNTISPEEIAQAAIPGEGHWADNARDLFAAALRVDETQNPSKPSKKPFREALGQK